MEDLPEGLSYGGLEELGGKLPNPAINVK